MQQDDNRPLWLPSDERANLLVESLKIARMNSTASMRIPITDVTEFTEGKAHMLELSSRAFKGSLLLRMVTLARYHCASGPRRQSDLGCLQFPTMIDSRGEAIHSCFHTWPAATVMFVVAQEGADDLELGKLSY